MLKYAYWLGAKLAEDEVAGSEAMAAMIHILSAGVDEDKEESDNTGTEDVDTQEPSSPSWGAPVQVQNSQDIP